MKGKRQTIFGFPEELKPCGKPGIKCLTHLYEERQQFDLSKILVSRVTTHPWFIIMWEPLTTKVPNPNLVRVWCCYVKTVIFYLRPYTVEQFHRKGYRGPVKPGHEYAKWAQIETAFRCDDVVKWEGGMFKVGAGRIRYANGQWWCVQNARRHQPASF